MKKIGIIITLLLIVLSLGGCENNTSKKAIEQGKIEMANKEYDKALNSFKVAIDEGSSREEAKRLTTLINNYKKANDEFGKGNIKEANEIMNKIDEETIEDSIKNDIDDLKSKINKQDKVNKEIADIKELIKDKKYKEADKLIKEINISNLNDNNKNQINKLKSDIYLGMTQI